MMSKGLAAMILAEASKKPKMPSLTIEIESEGGDGDADVMAGLEASFADFAAAFQTGDEKAAMMALKDFIHLCVEYGPSAYEG
jgi:hypothetical protein